MDIKSTHLYFLPRNIYICMYIYIFIYYVLWRTRTELIVANLNIDRLYLREEYFKFEYLFTVC